MGCKVEAAANCVPASCCTRASTGVCEHCYSQSRESRCLQESENLKAADRREIDSGVTMHGLK